MQSAHSSQTRATSWQGSCESKQICWEHLVTAQYFYSKCIANKFLTLKIKIKVTEYTICNGPIRWQISTSMKAILEHLSLALTVFEIFTFKNSWSWGNINVIMYNICSGTIGWKIPNFLSDCNSNACIFQPILVKIATWKVWSWKFRSRSSSTTFAVMLFNGGYHPL